MSRELRVTEGVIAGALRELTQEPHHHDPGDGDDRLVVRLPAQHDQLVAAGAQRSAPCPG